MIEGYPLKGDIPLSLVHFPAIFPCDTYEGGGGGGGGGGLLNYSEYAYLSI